MMNLSIVRSSMVLQVGLSGFSDRELYEAIMWCIARAMINPNIASKSLSNFLTNGQNQLLLL